MGALDIALSLARGSTPWGVVFVTAQAWQWHLTVPSSVGIRHAGGVSAMAKTLAGAGLERE